MMRCAHYSRRSIVRRPVESQTRQKRVVKMDDEIGWYEIELTNVEQIQDIRTKFQYRYSNIFKQPKRAVLLSSWDINDRDPTKLPPGPHYYCLSPDSVQILNDLLEYPIARDCPKP